MLSLHSFVGFLFHYVFSSVLLLTTKVVSTTTTTAQALGLLELKQIHVITRHGARTPLPKEATTLEEDKVGSILTPLGQREHYDLGVWIRSRYQDSGFFDMYDPSLVRFESSALDRTLVSANSLALGLFPPVARMGQHDESEFDLLPMAPANIPIYSRSSRNDIQIRAYQNCPIFHDKLSKLYKSSEWVNKESNHEFLLSKIASSFPQFMDDTKGFIPLENVWNVYDAIHVAKTECDEDPYTFACLQLPDPSIRDILDDDTWTQLEILAHEAEYMKYGQTTAGKLLGSNLLWRILRRTPSEEHFFHYSAHYPTLLGMFSTIQQEPFDMVLPDYASAIIFEIYEEPIDKRRTVKVLYKQGDKDDAVEYIPLRQCPQVERNDDACLLVEMIDWATDNTIPNEVDWCLECGNDSADVCMEAALESHCSPIADDLARVFNNNKGDNNPSGPIIGAFLFGIIFGMFIFAVCSLCMSSNKAKIQENDQLSPTDPIPTSAGSSSEPVCIENAVLS